LYRYSTGAGTRTPGAAAHAKTPQGDARARSSAEPPRLRRTPNAAEAAARGGAKHPERVARKMSFSPNFVGSGGGGTGVGGGSGGGSGGGGGSGVGVGIHSSGGKGVRSSALAPSRHLRVTIGELEGGGDSRRRRDPPSTHRSTTDDVTTATTTAGTGTARPVTAADPYAFADFDDDATGTAPTPTPAAGAGDGGGVAASRSPVGATAAAAAATAGTPHAAARTTGAGLTFAAKMQAKATGGHGHGHTGYTGYTTGKQSGAAAAGGMPSKPPPHTPVGLYKPNAVDP
jgi:hypothetical protein